MRFYTNVHQRFDEILVRGYENGKHLLREKRFIPLFMYLRRKNQSLKPQKVRVQNQLNLVKYLSAKVLLRNILVQKILMYMVMTDISASIFLRDIQRKKLSLILVKLNQSRLTLRLLLKVVFPMSLIVQKNYLQLLYKIIQQRKQFVLHLVHLIIQEMM